MHDELDFNLQQPVDRVVINVPSSSSGNSNIITDPENYLQCLTAPRDGTPTGVICSGNTDSEVTIEDYITAIDDICKDEGLCNECNRVIPEPTGSPTRRPTTDPTLQPTIDPTATPSQSPTSEPTKDPTKTPTADPTQTPSSSPTTSEPTTSPTPPVCDEILSGLDPTTFSYEFAIIMDNSCGLNETECDIQLNQAAELFWILKSDVPPHNITRIIFAQYSENGAEIIVGLRDTLQLNKQDYYDYIINSDACGAGGNGQTDLISGLNITLQQFITNGNPSADTTLRKIYLINNCIDHKIQNTSNGICNSIYNDYETTFVGTTGRIPIDRVILNIPPPSNRANNTINGNGETYLDCLIQPNGPFETGGICAAENDEQITIQDYHQFLEPTSDCANEHICFFNRRDNPEPTGSPTLRPTTSPSKTPSKSPTDDPTQIPSGTPTTDPTVNPTASPSKTPTSYPTTTPSKTPTDDPTSWPSKSPTSEPTESPTLTCPRDSTGWSEWSKWSNCSTYLDANITDHYKHIHYRFRSCLCPEQYDKCIGDAMEIEECDTDCIAIWTPWCPWSKCIIQDFSCILDKSGNGICSGFEFRTRSCYRQLWNNELGQCNMNCTCHSDEYGDSTSELRPCQTRDCLQVQFDNNGDNKCRPQWRFEIDNDINNGFDNHILQHGGYINDDCIIIQPNTDYLLVVSKGCGTVKWIYRGDELGLFKYSDSNDDKSSADYNYKSFPINIQNFYQN